MLIKVDVNCFYTSYLVLNFTTQECLNIIIIKFCCLKLNTSLGTIFCQSLLELNFY